MKQKRFIALILLCVLLESTVLHYLRIFSVKPDLVLICLVLSSVYFFGSTALWLSLICGIAKDLLGIHAFGVFTVAYPLICFCIVQISKRIDFESGIVVAAVLFLASIGVDLLVRFILASLASGVSLAAYLRISTLQAFYTTALFWPVSAIIRKVIPA